MELNDYQTAAMSTCMATSNNTSYMITGLAGEVGELCGKYAKAVRKEYISIDGNDAVINPQLSAAEQAEIRNSILDELGDVLWFVAGMCEVLNTNMNHVAKRNLDKLASRKQRGVIDGSGDNR